MKRILGLIALLIPLSIFAFTPESGKVYRIKNFGKATYLSVSPSASSAATSNFNKDDLKQQWLLEAPASGNGYFFRNVSTGAYLQSPKDYNIPWPLVFTTTPVTETMLMAVTDYNGNSVIRPTTHNNSYGYAHSDSGNNIVCWEPSGNNSQWVFEEINLTPDEITAIKKRFEDTGDLIAKAPQYQQNLGNLFNDVACTSLKVTGDLSGNSDYLALPVTLQRMVDKIKDNDWSETAVFPDSYKGTALRDWNSDYAKKYRVQKYEPYSEGSAASNMAGIQAYTNMNNPTGIVADENDILYIMLEGEIKDGASLYILGIPDNAMYNNVTAGTKLKPGLNMVICNADNSHYFIYYSVATASNKLPVKGRELNNYQPLKIHIEGGRPNGFFNYIGDDEYKPDREEDYRYTVARATHPMYDLIGKYVILHFFLEDTPDLPGDSKLQLGVKSCLDSSKNPANGANKRYDPAAIMKSWDNMCFSERILMGIQSDEDIYADASQPFGLCSGFYESIVNDSYQPQGVIYHPDFQYSDYFNNRMMGITLQASGLYMNATAWRTAYAPSTMSAILSQFGLDGVWGPAHEYGHMNQTPMRIAGTTEVSNNVFSNVAVWFSDQPTTSRADFMSNQLDVFNSGKTYLENGTWGTTRMFWQLWLYYHATGHNKKFYPRLYELLRRNPLNRDMTTHPGKLNPRYDMLHFAKMACLAAEEDLTNFFTAWGFFVPLDNYHIDDYDIYDCILTQEDIDAVKAEIKAYGFNKNDAIILIDDRPGNPRPSYPGFNKTEAGEYGGLQDFENGKIPQGNFNFTIDGNTVTIQGGNPGAGYLIYDKEGNLLGFSNSDSFELSSEAACLLISGEATLASVGADTAHTTSQAVNIVQDGSLEDKKSLLKKLIDNCDALIDLTDETETKVGAIIPEYTVELKKSRDEAYTLWQNATESQSKELTDNFISLSDAYYSLLNDESARVKVIPGASYAITNLYYPDYILSSNSSKLTGIKISSLPKVIPFEYEWLFEPVDPQNPTTIYLKNVGNSLYAGTTKKQSVNIPAQNNQQSYTIETIRPGVYGLSPDGLSNFGIHLDSGKNIVQWYTSSNASNWSLTKVHNPSYFELKIELNNNIENARRMLSMAGNYSDDGSFEPSIDFPYVTEEIMKNLKEAIDKADASLNDVNATESILENLSSILTQAMDNLSEVMVPEVDVTEIRLGSEKIVMKIGEDTLTLVAEIAPENATFPKYEWMIEDESIVRFTSNVGNTATIEPVSMGETLIKVNVAGNPLVYAQATIKVLPPLPIENIIISPSQLTTPLNSSDFTLDVEIYPNDASYQFVSWETSDPTVAEINSETGLIKLQRQGTTIISASSNDGSDTFGTCVLTVSNPVANGILISPGEAIIERGYSTQFNATYIPAEADQPLFIWESEDSLIATVEPSGLVTGQSEGKTNIKVKADINGREISATAEVTVFAPVIKTLSLSANSLNLQNGTSANIEAICSPEEIETELVWIVDNPEIVRLSDTNDPGIKIINALKPGMTSITVTDNKTSDLSAVCTVSVTPNPASTIKIIIDEPVFDIKDGKQILTAQFEPADAATPVLLWDSSNEDVATVSPLNDLQCELNPVNEGKTTVSVAHADNPSVRDEVEVMITESSGIALLFEDSKKPFNVYDYNGRIIKLNASAKELNELKPGLYIVRQGEVSKEVIVK